ncbi:MAG: ABC transporter permease subunit [Hydrogenophilales bacterium]
MIRTIFFKELKILFVSPLSWIMLGLMQIIFAWIFFSRVDYFLSIQFQLGRMSSPPGLTEIVNIPVFGVCSIVLLVITPLLTMRLFSEEKKNQTLPLLFSSPISIFEITLGKFLSVMFFASLFPILIFFMTSSLIFGGNLDLGLMMSCVIGILLLSSCLLSIGIFISSLTSSPIVAAMGGFGINLILWLINIASEDPETFIYKVSLINHFENFLDGTVYVKDVLYFLIITFFMLLLTIKKINNERF